MVKQVLVVALLAVLVLGAACGGDDDGQGDGGDASPVPSAVEGATKTPPVSSAIGTLELDATTASVGQTLTLTGGSWPGEGPVSVYLLSEEQAEDNQTAARTIASQEAVKLGESPADDEGNFSFEFVLDGEPAAENGDLLTVASGATLTVFAVRGTSGTRSEPFTVQ